MGGAVSVKVEEVVRPTSKARAPEVASAGSLDQKLAAYWTARGELPEKADRDRIIGRALALEGEVSHAAA
jgi:hypothetical protein